MTKKKMVKKAILIATMLVTGAAFTLAGNTSEVSAAGIPGAPAKVSLVSVKRTGEKVVAVKWKKAKGASGYRVYRKTGSGKYVRLKTISGGSRLQFSDTKASQGKTYRYVVRAYKSYKARIYYNKRTKKWQNSSPLLAKNRGPVKVVTKARFGKLSNVKQIKVTKITAPKAPKSITVANTKDGIRVTVSKVAGAAGYEFYRWESYADSHRLIGTQKSNVFLDRKVKAGTYYHYYVKAYKTVYGKKYRGDRIWLTNSLERVIPKSGSGSSGGTSSPAGESSAADTPSSSGGSSGSSGSSGQAGSGGSSTVWYPVTRLNAWLHYYGTMYPGEDARKPTKDLEYNDDRLCENSYFVLQARLICSDGVEDPTKPASWTVKENSIGATTEAKGRNLIVKTPIFNSREQYDGKLVVTMHAEGLTKDIELTPLAPNFEIPYEDLVKGRITSEQRRGLLWPTLDSSASNSEIKATVESVTRGCTTDRQKVGKIIEWFNRNIEYKRYTGYSQMVPQVWKNKGAVCQGMSRLLAQMMRYAGIPAGQYNTTSDINHACTVFWMEGQWYSTDGTCYYKGKTLYRSAQQYMTPVSTGISCIHNGPNDRLGYNLVGGYLWSR